MNETNAFSREREFLHNVSRQLNGHLYLIFTVQYHYSYTNMRRKQDNEKSDCREAWKQHKREQQGRTVVKEVHKQQNESRQVSCQSNQ